LRGILGTQALVITLTYVKKAQRHGVLFDLDGTLVDSVYQHTRIWWDVLTRHGWHVPHWMVHRGIGLTSERLMSWLLGEVPSNADAMIDEHDRAFLACAQTLTPTEGAVTLLDELERHEVPFCAVTSAGTQTREALFKALGRNMPYAGHTADHQKPNPSPLTAGAEHLGLAPNELVMIGDAIWDGEAARRAAMHFIGLRCGGTSDELLRQAGALWVEDSPRSLMGRLA
jgi:phosphoglycolate phosphatase-like HAD superfamily hydrolase